MLGSGFRLECLRALGFWGLRVWGRAFYEVLRCPLTGPFWVPFGAVNGSSKASPSWGCRQAGCLYEACSHFFFYVYV